MVDLPNVRQNSSPRATHAIARFVMFAAVTFALTWGSGVLLMFSTHAELVNGAPLGASLVTRRHMVSPARLASP